MITLYQRTDCPFCWKVRLALAELQLAYEVVEISLGEKHPDLASFSPTGSVPVLVDGEVIIWESAVILDYLDLHYAPGKLLPRQATEQVSVRLLHAYSDKLVGASLRDLVFEKRSKPAGQWDEALIRESEDRWVGCMARLEQELGEREFFGPGLSAADAALGARFGVAEAYGVGVTEDFPGLYRWFRSIRKRPGWAAAYPTSFIGLS